MISAGVTQISTRTDTSKWLRTEAGRQPTKSPRSLSE
jgi:hypothetical protein